MHPLSQEPDEVPMAYDNKHPDDTLSEEASAFGKRVKGAAKDGIGAITGNEHLEREGERENAEGRARQANNDVIEETDGVCGETVRNSAVVERAASSVTATPPNSIREEAAATGQRMKGAVKDAAGAVTGNERLEREGERENAQGRMRQAEIVTRAMGRPRAGPEERAPASRTPSSAPRRASAAGFPDARWRR